MKERHFKAHEFTNTWIVLLMCEFNVTSNIAHCSTGFSEVKYEKHEC